MVRKFLATLDNPDFKRINYGLIERETDVDLVHHIVDACRSLSVVEYIEFLDYEYVTDEREIDTDKYVRRRKSNKRRRAKDAKNDNLVITEDDKVMSMYDSRYGELRARFKVTCKGEEQIVTKSFLIPVKDRDGYYTIKGKRFFLIYQLVDSSTYAKGHSIIFKSIMPVVINREATMIEDTDGNEHGGNIYTLMVLLRPINIFYLLFAQSGDRALNYMSINTVVRFTEKEEDKENNYYFKISNTLFLEARKEIFDKHKYLRDMVATILDVTTNRLRITDIENRDFWIERIGGLSVSKSSTHYDRGLDTMTIVRRMLDESIKGIIKVNNYNKTDIFSVVRWVIQNFDALRKKDDVDLANKRLRANECIASLFTHQLSIKIKNLMGYRNRVTMQHVLDVFKIPGDIIIQQMHKSNLFHFDERINDMDFWTKLKYTLKGPNSMGGNNARKVSNKYRDIHPSYIGRIDINVCGTSDPGLSGVMTPWVETDGLYFDTSGEPEDGVFEFEESVRRYQELVDAVQEVVKINLGGERTFENVSEMRRKFQDVTNSVVITKRYESVAENENNVINMDEQ